MFTFLSQHWLAIRGATGIAAPIVQSEGEWLDLHGFQDVVAWLDCKQVSLGGATSLSCQLMTSPTKDEGLFTIMATVPITASGLSITTVLKDFNSGPVLARWLRWQVAPFSSPTSVWDMTFRLFISANAPGKGNRVIAQGRGDASLRQAPPIAPPSTPMHLRPGEAGGAMGGAPTRLSPTSRR